MTEENLFKKVDQIDLYNDGIGYVQLYDASHANESEEQRIYTVSTIGSLAYGNDEAKNPERLYEKLKELKHESCFEFCRPCFTGYTINDSIRNKQNDILWYERQYEDLSSLHKQNIACFRIKVPIFVARQFMRHRSGSYLEISRRYTKNSKVPFQFWYPENFSGNKLMFESQWLQDYDALLLLQQYDTQIASRFLPQVTYTEFYCMFEQEGLKNYFELRTKKDAQQQIRDLSFAMLALLEKNQPELYKKVKPDV